MLDKINARQVLIYAAAYIKLRLEIQVVVN